MVYDKGRTMMKPSHRPTTVLAALLAAGLLLGALGGGIPQAAAADLRPGAATPSVSEPPKGGVHTKSSVTLPANVTTYVGATITVSPSYHGYGNIQKLSISDPKLATAKAVNGGRNIQITGKKAGSTSMQVTFSNGARKTTQVKVAKGSAKLSRATAKLYPGKTVTIRPKYKGVVSIRKVAVKKGKVASVKLTSGSKAFMLLAKKLGSTKVTVTFTNGTVRNMTLYVYEKPKSNSLSVQWLDDSYRPSSGKYTVNLRVKNRCHFKITSATIRVDVKLSNGKKRQLEKTFSLALQPGGEKELTVRGQLPGSPKRGKAGCTGFHFDFT